MLSKMVFLMVHGFGASSQWWQRQRAYFERRGRIVAVDLPGHGRKPWHDETLETMSDQVMAELQLSSDEKAVGLGSSFGGMVMIKSIEKYPHLFSHIILAGSMPRFTATPDFPAGLSLEKIDKLAAQLKGDRQAVMTMFFRSLFTRQERLLPDHARVKEMYQHTPVPSYEVLHAFLQILATEDLRRVLARTPVPVQVVLGDADPICPLAVRSSLEGMSSMLRVDQVKECGHFPFLSRPDEFNARVDGFIQTCH
ncbi:MAG: alpha/beta fold hydrolase [Candidatus Omnitrophica bacterium]|nr:alpha/beta fold hydrolase [Candidatus Omnitrophota bacterium]